ncbi:hypothetical protein [Pseudactinotalea terrae]|uniref:hypothetical protein n=1 Tax=Pseudactinotalea terrae TaxID=1743262 RepID=UPI0012E2D056|nr:hypothetical protein [Pseudactinotalea terrae]
MTDQDLPPRVNDMLEDPAVLAQMAQQHGMGDPDGELNGNLQHLLSPLVGALSLTVQHAENPTSRDVHMLGRLSLAVALLTREQVRQENGDTVPDWPDTLTGIQTLPHGSWKCATATFADRAPVSGLGRTAEQAEIEAWKVYAAELTATEPGA